MTEFPIKSHYNHTFYAFCDVITSRQQSFAFGLKYLCKHNISRSFKVGQEEKNRAMLLQIVLYMDIVWMLDAKAHIPFLSEVFLRRIEVLNRDEDVQVAKIKYESLTCKQGKNAIEVCSVTKVTAPRQLNRANLARCLTFILKFCVQTGPNGLGLGTSALTRSAYHLHIHSHSDYAGSGAV